MARPQDVPDRSKKVQPSNQKTDQYNIGTLNYPADVGTRPDLQHYVAFYINVRGKSKFERNNRFGGVLNDSGTTSLSSSQKGTAVRNIAGGTAALAAIGGIAGALSGGSAASRIGSAVAGAGTAAAAGVVATAAQNSSFAPLFSTDNKQRLKDVVVLHMQEPPSVKYGVNYQDTDLGVLTGLLGQTASIGDSTFQKEAGLLLALEVAKIPSAIAGGGQQFASLVGAQAKIKTNPFREVLFEGIDYRTFNFRYRFMPKDYNESKQVRDIIEKFKFHMHPELSDNKLFYIYPSEFEIVYYYRGQENQWFNKIRSCALTDMQVEYGGDKFATFDDGSPVETVLTLTFRELELLTKKEIEGGY